MNENSGQEIIFKAEGIKKLFPIKGTFGKTIKNVHAVNGVTFSLKKGETYGIVGESGCGKSTLGRTLLRLIEPSEGKLVFMNQDLLALSKREFRSYRKKIQMVFQDPYSSLNPRKRIGKIIEEPLIIHHFQLGAAERKRKVLDLLKKVGLSEDYYDRYPHEFSGGQRQRVGIARALITNPEIIIFDEPVSALDVSVQSQVINLLEEMQKEYQLTYIFIAHDLSVVRHISDRLNVMYLGHTMEEADTKELFENPQHPYTKSLLSAVPVPNPKVKKEKIVLNGEIPSPIDLPSGCVFHTRCPFAVDKCKKVKPEFKQIGVNHRVACHLVEITK